MRSQGPPAVAPSSMTCSLEVSCPLLKVFCAKLMTVEGVVRPGTCNVNRTLLASVRGRWAIHVSGAPAQQVCIMASTRMATLMVLKAAA